LRTTNDFDIFNNPFDIQTVHRIFAWIVFVLSLILFQKTRKTSLEKTGKFILILVLLQIILGISTLLFRVQIHLATIHQFVAILILLSTVHLTYLSSKKTE
jgi:cytochrome c oxidase assembly protein subunit 15